MFIKTFRSSSYKKEQFKYLFTSQEANVLGFKGPRKMTVVVPGMLNENKRKEFRPDSDNDGIIGNSTCTYIFFTHALQSRV